MTPDKLPDVVWIIPEKGSLWAYREEQGYTSERAYVRKEALDAMTAERDAWKQTADIAVNAEEMAARERDSAREALAKATKQIAEAREHATFNVAHDDPSRLSIREGQLSLIAELLAAQPETKL